MPSFELTWTGYTAPTTLVVEALDSGCPFQGHLSPDSKPASKPGNVSHQAWLTMDDARAASATHEVFINGQFDGGKLPKPIARSFIKVTPKPHAKMDFFETFAPVQPAKSSVRCRAAPRTATKPGVSSHRRTIRYSSMPRTGPAPVRAYIPSGAYWANIGSRMPTWRPTPMASFRLTPTQKATLASSSFLHVTMEADAYATARRYPQIIISTADAPVQYGLEKNHSLIVQPRAQIGTLYDYPVEYELQICNLRTWDVNNQCPVYNLHQIMNGKDVVSLTPNDEFGEHASVDHRILFDVFYFDGPNLLVSRR